MELFHDMQAVPESTLEISIRWRSPDLCITGGSSECEVMGH
jgi:hypothetical protein